MLPFISRVILISGLLMWELAAIAAPPVSGTWQSEAALAKSLKKSAPHEAALHLVKCMQLVQQQKGAGTDERIKSLYLNDMTSLILFSKLPQQDRIKLAEWEFASAQSVFGAHSPYACIALQDVQAAKDEPDLNKLLEYQIKMTPADQTEYIRLTKIRQAQNQAAIDEAYQKIQSSLDKLNRLK